MNLGDYRAAVVAALEALDPVAAGDWTVHAAPVDAIEPPAYVISWGPDPWRIVETMCTDLVTVEVIAVAHRLEPEANVAVLEAMVDGAVGALQSARLRPFQTLAPGPIEIAQVTYLGARLQIRRSITTAAPEPAPPPPPGDAQWLWGDLGPTDVDAAAYENQLTPRAAGMTYRAEVPGVIEGLGFYRAGADLTTSRRVGLWHWNGDLGVLEYRQIVTTEASRFEGWVRQPLADPLVIGGDMHVNDQFTVMAEIPAGSGFYHSPWVDSTIPTVEQWRQRGWAEGFPTPTDFPNNYAANVGVSNVIFTDLQYRST